jgi:hypothetical protein
MHSHGTNNRRGAATMRECSRCIDQCSRINIPSPENQKQKEKKDLYALTGFS